MNRYDRREHAAPSLHPQDIDAFDALFADGFSTVVFGRRQHDPAVGQNAYERAATYTLANANRISAVQHGNSKHRPCE
ncbi:hypothetical protein [Paraburkholderia sp. J94]|uniref:hypothetical protein n=1 Tax=Paraburkholderia sp. J94 TaxID=2805441 RepID=UPI002AB06A20|nr:hypothetical protein [Paraburkholderia sp. J94]